MERGDTAAAGDLAGAFVVLTAAGGTADFFAAVVGGNEGTADLAPALPAPAGVLFGACGFGGASALPMPAAAVVVLAVVLGVALVRAPWGTNGGSDFPAGAGDAAATLPFELLSRRAPSPVAAEEVELRGVVAGVAAGESGFT